MNKVAKGMKGLQDISPNHTNWQQESTLNWQNQMMMGGFNEMMIRDSGHQQGNPMKMQLWDPKMMIGYSEHQQGDPMQMHPGDPMNVNPWQNQMMMGHSNHLQNQMIMGHSNHQQENPSQMQPGAHMKCVNPGAYMKEVNPTPPKLTSPYSYSSGCGPIDSPDLFDLFQGKLTGNLTGNDANEAARRVVQWGRGGKEIRHITSDENNPMAPPPEVIAPTWQ